MNEKIMNEKNVEKLIEAGIILPLAGEKSVFWDSGGVMLLENLKKQLRRLYHSLNMRELVFPSVFDRKYFPDSIINEEYVIGTEEGGEMLTPFSETVYLYLLDSLRKKGINFDSYRRVFCWTKGFIKEKTPDLSYNSSEILRYECFFAEEEKNAAAAWNKYNEAFKEFIHNVLMIQPIEGDCQGIRSFPKAERTYSLGLKTDDDLYRTIFVSHILKKEFISDVGLLEGEQVSLLSSCFSQKAVFSVLLHHRDKHGIRIPSSIAPVRGIIISDSYNADDDSVKTFGTDMKEEIEEIIIRECAVWGIVHCESCCRVVERNGFAESEFDSITEALEHAHRYEKEFDMQLLRDSEEKNRL